MTIYVPKENVAIAELWSVEDFIFMWSSIHPNVSGF